MEDYRKPNIYNLIQTKLLGDLIEEKPNKLGGKRKNGNNRKR